MTHQIDAKDGYIRAQVGLKLIDSSAIAAFDDLRSGYLDLLTEDGRLRLKISQSVAEDLMIDLQQFLRTKPLTTPSASPTMK